MRFVHTPNAICATTETGRVSGAILKRPPEWAESLWDRLAPQVCELLSAQPRGVTCADLIAQGYLQPMTDKRDEVIAELRSALAETQRAVGVAQTASRDVELSETDLRELLNRQPGSASLMDPRANVWVRRV